MDIVVTFVDGTDPLWQQDYARRVGGETLAKRYRDWGLLKYWFRGVDRHMPFIEYVHLVVSRDSQVPQWVNRDKVRIVLHKDIIPQEFLPVFNSNAIEMFLPKVPNLGEEFLYFNDDMYVVQDCTPQDFFTKEGKINLGFSPHLFIGSSYKRFCKNSDVLVRKIAGIRKSLIYRRPEHICTPLYKSACDEFYAKAEDEILKSATALRQPGNLSQYIYSDYLFYTGRATGKRLPKKHFSLARYQARDIARWLEAPATPFTCINDVEMTDEKFTEGKAVLQAAFEARYPEKSRFEN